MLRYSLYKSKLVKLCLLFLLVSFAFTSYVVVDIFTLRSYQSSLDHLTNTNIAQIPCAQFCPNYIEDAGDFCCNLDTSICYMKNMCLQQAISNYQTQVDVTNNFIYYFSIPAFFFFVTFLVTLIYCLILRKKSMEQQERAAIQSALLAEQPIIMEDEDQFDSYEDFIQYMVENGYLFYPKKKGDVNITASFITVDENMCPICMMEYNQEKVLKLKCEHKFHSGCIRDWNKQNSSCPICRADIYQ